MIDLIFATFVGIGILILIIMAINKIYNKFIKWYNAPSFDGYKEHFENLTIPSEILYAPIKKKVKKRYYPSKNLKK